MNLDYFRTASPGRFMQASIMRVFMMTLAVVTFVGRHRQYLRPIDTLGFA
jgi:hypothetical protein